MALPFIWRGKECYQFRSERSGFLTRVCANEAEANYELHRLDDKWELLQRLWDDSILDQQQLHVRLTLELTLVLEAGRVGMVPHSLSPEDEPADEDFEIWQSVRPDDEAKYVILPVGGVELEQAWRGRVTDVTQLTVILERLRQLSLRRTGNDT